MVLKDLYTLIFFTLMPAFCFADGVPKYDFGWLVQNSEDIVVGEVISASKSGEKHSYVIKTSDVFKSEGPKRRKVILNVDTSWFNMMVGGKYLLFFDEDLSILRESLYFEQTIAGKIFENGLWLRQNSIDRWHIDPIIRQKEVVYSDPSNEDDLFFSFLLINWDDLKREKLEPILAAGQQSSANK